MSYKVKLNFFDGPLDLLLFLIKKDKIDIYDIPILDITEQYLEYMELMKLLDLEKKQRKNVVKICLKNIHNLKEKLLINNELNQRIPIRI